MSDHDLLAAIKNGREIIQTLLVSKRSPRFEEFAEIGIQAILTAEHEIMRRIFEKKTKGK